MKGDITFFLVIVSFLVLAESYIINSKSIDDGKHTRYSVMDGRKPFVTRPRYGFGKRSEDVYEELKELSNDMIGDEKAALILVEENDDNNAEVNSDAQIPIIAVKSRRLLRQFGDEEKRIVKLPRRGRWGRFGGKRDMVSTNENDPSRWGRFGKRDEIEDPSRWGRFGKRDEIEDPSRWGRFGKRDEIEDPSRWGRFGKRSTEEKPSRWGRFGDEMYVSEREDTPSQSRWGRFGKRAIIIVDDSEKKN